MKPEIDYTHKEVAFLTTLSRDEPYVTIDFSWNIVNQINQLMPPDLQIFADKNKKEYAMSYSDSVYIRVYGFNRKVEIVIVLSDLTEHILSIDKDDNMCCTMYYYNKGPIPRLDDEDLLLIDEYIDMINILVAIFCNQLNYLKNTPYDNMYLKEVRMDDQISRFMTDGINRHRVLSLPPLII
jgi:hypothetical protein